MGISICGLPAVLLGVVYLLCSSCNGQLSTDVDELLNWCIDGIHHKERPSTEDELHHMCTPWKSRSCCTHNVSRKVHTGSLYGFDWNHCSVVKNMSPKCQRHFIQDLCFYECEPNVGPWVVKVDMKIRKERFFNVPLCASDCDKWFDDCKDEYTCVDNWTTMFVFSKGKNHCPVSAKCRLFSEVFQSAKHFCESIWDYSWKYTPNHEPCMRLWFNGSLGNPNDVVARLKVEELMALGNTKSTVSGKRMVVICCLAWSAIQNFFARL